MFLCKTKNKICPHRMLKCNTVQANMHLFDLEKGRSERFSYHRSNVCRGVRIEETVRDTIIVPNPVISKV